MTSAQAVVSLASAVSSASCRRFPRTFPRNRFMPASTPAPGPEITMPELAMLPPPATPAAPPARPRRLRSGDAGVTAEVARRAAARIADDANPHLRTYRAEPAGQLNARGDGEL